MILDKRLFCPYCNLKCGILSDLRLKDKSLSKKKSWLFSLNSKKDRNIQQREVKNSVMLLFPLHCFCKLLSNSSSTAASLQFKSPIVTFNLLNLNFRVEKTTLVVTCSNLLVKFDVFTSGMSRPA